MDKVNDRLFHKDTMDFLMGQKDGANYVALYMMLLLMSANTNGKLQTEIGEIIVPVNIDKIVRDTKYFSKDTVIVGLELFKKLGLFMKIITVFYITRSSVFSRGKFFRTK